MFLLFRSQGSRRRKEGAWLGILILNKGRNLDLLYSTLTLFCSFFSPFFSLLDLDFRGHERDRSVTHSKYRFFTFILYKWIEVLDPFSAAVDNKRSRRRHPDLRRSGDRASISIMAGRFSRSRREGPALQPTFTDTSNPMA